MLDIQLIREKPEVIRADLKKRGDAEKAKLFEELIEKDKELRKISAQADELRARRNLLGTQISKAKKEGKDASRLLQELKELPKKIEETEREASELEARTRYILMRLPNILQSDVPAGKDDSDNVEIRKWGKTPEFSFEPKGHEELALALDGVDLERAAKISGARFYFLKNDIALLDLALQRFAVDVLLKKKFVLVYPPEMMRRTMYEGVTDLADFETVLYRVEGEDLYPIATSEHPIAAMFSDEVLDDKKLPMRFAGISHCFRKEAGAHGKDTKGIFRVHQFNKVEQFVFCKPEDSKKIHEELIRNAEEIFAALELPYRVVNVCTGDIGTVAAKKYDLEVWLPAQNRYREMVSCSNATDYQARRLNIRFGRPGEPRQPLVHTLNSTAIATPRAIVAILENFQQPDGSVLLPKVLWPYMNGIKKLEPKVSNVLKTPKKTLKG